jgi:hypothetical protein
MHAVLALGEQNSQDPQTEKRRHIHKQEKEVAQLQQA